MYIFNHFHNLRIILQLLLYHFKVFFIVSFRVKIKKRSKEKKSLIDIEIINFEGVTFYLIKNIS